MNRYAADLTAIRQAAARIAPFAQRTPVFTCAVLDRMAERSLFFKCEQWQKAGAFKFRGACNAVMKLTEDVAARGVVTHSSGNHAGALARAARLRGIAAHIVMPRNASAVKRAAVEEYGARVVACEPNQQAREATAERVLADTGATLIHPYDNADVIAGQGTAALELLEQVADLDAIITPVGGGGLLSGTALAVRELDPTVRVFAGEPAGADDAARSKAAGQLMTQNAPRTVADGLLTSLGDLTWPVVRDLVERIITVSEEQIVTAMRLLWERAKLLVEPSAAVPLAAVLADECRALDGLGRIGIVLSGGNVDVKNLPF
ncbi:MAG: pyridoxal-phosphate dependent enzyme [Planctomycetes bacterium]|nr:pyridoxal-phosphate dependent enzyme [Planctomycetota bacterium]